MELVIWQMALYNTALGQERCHQSTIHWANRVKHSGSLPAFGLIHIRARTSPTPSTADWSGITIEEVIVTGPNIPTSEEVGPNPVDTYRWRISPNWGCVR